MIVDREAAGQGAEAAAALRPGILEWVARLVTEGELPRGFLIRTRVIGAVYGTQQSVIDEIVDDHLAMAVLLLHRQDREYAQQAIDAVGDAEHAVTFLGDLATDLARAAGTETEGPRTRARERGFAALDDPYRIWLRTLADAADPDEQPTLWRRQAHRIISGLGDRLLAEAPRGRVGGPDRGHGQRHRVVQLRLRRRRGSGDEQLLNPSELGVRTKKVAEILAGRITDLDASIKDAEALHLATEVIETATGSKMVVPERKARTAKADDAGGRAQEVVPQSKYLMFLGARQLDGLAALAVEGAADIAAYLKDKDNKARAKQIADTRHSVDIALFGRMVADSTDFNVDAAAQVAHAISVHRVDNESDYYTAVDDENTDAESGAGMIGTVDFNSATLHRYAAVSVHRLAANLGEGLREDEAVNTPVRRAVEASVHAFVASLPKGKINTFGHHTLPDAVVVKLRTTRPISFVASFEEQVSAESGGGHVRGAVARLAEYIPEVERAYGDEQSTRVPTRHWCLAA